jgi:hypothetical protein
VSLGDLSREPLNQAELDLAWTEILRAQNDRGAAIMASAFVDQSLARALGKRSRFKGMIESGYEQGLYKGLVYNDLHVIRRVRNAFGHATRAITFDTPDVIEEVNKFQYVKWLQMNGGLTFGLRNLGSPHRETYTNICQALINDLYMVSVFGVIVPDFSNDFGPVDWSIRH